MRLSFIIFAFCLFQLSASVYSQNGLFTIKTKDITMRELFHEIEQQSQFRFFYNDVLTNIDQKISIDLKDKSIIELLDIVVANSGITYRVLDNQLIVVSPVALLQQGITITGTVTDADGQPLPGASVVVKGIAQGTVTNANGTYSINVSDGNATLVFSFVGYVSQEFTVGDKRTINVTLSEDTREIEEVVVVGYGTVRKQDLTGSIGSVKAEDIVLRGTTSVIGAMQGTVPGVDISQAGSRMGNSFNIQIRGQNSLTAGSPLYVVDGVITDNIDFLNPMEIERIDILKDASSTAIYGSRGSNGVVLVTTKTADFGAKSKTTVSYDGYFGYKKVAHLPEFMDGREFVEHRSMCYYTWDAVAGKWNSGTWMTEPVLAQRLYDRDFFDWVDATLQDGKQQNHYVNISGNAKDISYNVGVGYQNEDGNFIREEYNRYNLNVSVNHRPSKYFQVGATIKLSFTDFNGGSTTSYSSSMNFAPIFHAYHADGSYVKQPAIASEIGANYTGAANPLLSLKSENEQTRNYRVIGSFFAQVSPIAGLDIRTTFSPSFIRNRKGYSNSGIEGLVDNSGSSDNRENFDYIWNNQISYTKTFGKHRLNAMFINDVYSTRYERLYVTSRLFPYDSEWYNLFSGQVTLGDCRAAYEETSMLSFGGRVNYDYAGKYLATATLRYDGSSKLVKKWSSFPSFALAWRLSEEEFMQAPWLSNLKARFSFGYSGNNSGVTPFGSLQKPVTGSTVYYDYNGAAVSGFVPGSPVNESLSWEKTREANFGIDFGFLKNRINGSIEVYDKLSDGLLMQRKLAMESGVGSMTDNIGSVNNRGIELSLNTINIDNNDFFWSTSLTFSRNRSAIRTLYGRKEDVPSERRFIGEPVNILYDYKILGIWTQAEYNAGLSAYYNPNGSLYYKAKPGEVKTQDTNGDGILNSDDRVILGGPDPSWTGSFTSNFQYKNWDFSFVIYTRQGVLYDCQFTRTFGWPSGRGQNKVKYEYYIPQNLNVCDWDNFIFENGKPTQIGVKSSGEGRENSKYPIYQNAGGAYYGSNHSYKDGSFVKVKNIVLGYTFNRDWIKKIGMSHLRVYVNVLNPFIFSNYIGWDPEYGSLSMASGNGPSNVIYQAGLNVKF